MADELQRSLVSWAKLAKDEGFNPTTSQLIGLFVLLLLMLISVASGTT